MLKALQRAGWQLREKGGTRHYVLVRRDLPGIVTVPRHPRIRKKTLGLIIKQAGLTLGEFEKLYK
ncbi:MAG: hypothetical protein AMJ81_13130 [Phycisphaerae bacterium SM23_33]|nr:MAG: hypothetical protein AMJ81_13130 [Phycisphaerae bacterium SM23_33]